MWDLFPAQTQWVRIAAEIEQACNQAKTLGLSDADIREVLDHVRGIPGILSTQIPEQVWWRALQRSLDEEWRYPLV